VDKGDKVKKQTLFKKLERILLQIQKQEVDHPWFHIPTIELYHAERKIRTNGSQKLSSFLDLFIQFDMFDGKRGMGGLRTLRKEILLTVEKCNKTIDLIGKAEHVFFSQYDICPDCKGRHGQMVRVPDRFGYVKDRKSWSDCKKCEGRGYILKGIKT
jgi:hypothetical protein